MSYPVQRVTLITLGVRNLAKSRAFYEALGWTPAEATPAVTFFQMQGMALGLFGLRDLAVDQGRPEVPLGTGGFTLAQNFDSTEDVDAAYAAAVAAGADPIRPPSKTYWGGYSGYYGDPDGHVWEIAWNPYWPLNEDGTLTLPGQG
ncbi:VOC family protein [Paenirhodobacter populi]|uniref:VOC family protein n=1 Tax=Paenirhodobacter populi TaxID=2306993 RepID=A0A443JNN2_9RHOB|nr:VOC family protein [Sinirhodobacter populi]RWR14470.1 VOC family protein [Sinirhodobacter populi]RWR22069.1 VOC family protein [Sinirhodobacter populi]RWR27140.1 VOC family protein [Sinirhodobacter populi]